MDTLDACVILHKKDLVGSVLMGIRDIARRVGKPLRPLLLVSQSGSADINFVKTECARLNIVPLDCRAFDDHYLDFSGYGAGLSLLEPLRPEGVLFVNDTFASKHDSGHLRSEMARQIALASAKTFPFPLIIGPYRHSEFGVSSAEFDTFVSSFIFYLNSPGMRILGSCIEELRAVETQLSSEVAAQPEKLERTLLQFCRVHALQLHGRYTGPDSDVLLARKLATAYAERMLSHRVKMHGVVWFVAGGVVGRVLVPVQQIGRRLFRKLAGKALL